MESHIHLRTEETRYIKEDMGKKGGKIELPSCWWLGCKDFEFITEMLSTGQANSTSEKTKTTKKKKKQTLFIEKCWFYMPSNLANTYSETLPHITNHVQISTESGYVCLSQITFRKVSFFLLWWLMENKQGK